MSACSQLCVNSVGSYRCECEKGYFLEEDGQTCTKGERGETSLFSSCFPFYPKKTDGVFSPADIWEPLHSPASCGFLLCSDFLAALEKTSQLVPTTTESVFAPDSVIAVGKRGIWGGGCRFATSSHEFIFHYHIFRNDWRVETPRCALFLDFLLICNSGDTSASKVKWAITADLGSPEHFTHHYATKYQRDWKITAQNCATNRPKNLSGSSTSLKKVQLLYFPLNTCLRQHHFRSPAVHLFEKSDNVMNAGTCSATCDEFLQIKMSVLQLKQQVSIQKKKKAFVSSMVVLLSLNSCLTDAHYLWPPAVLPGCPCSFIFIT